MEILPIGKLMKVDEEGFLVNESSKDKIVSPWKEAVDEMVDLCLKNIGDEIHSIYLRGSVSRGEAIEGISDIDLMIVVKGGNDKVDKSFTKDAWGKLAEKYPFSTEFEFQLLPLNELLTSDNHYSNRFFMKTYSICIFGDDITRKISRYKPDKETASHFHRNLSWVFEKAKERITNSSYVAEWCKWAMKRIVRAGFTLIMHKVGSFTRDLYPCFENFSKYYPEKADEMYKALEMAINSPENKDEILSVIDGIGVWLAQEIEKEFSEK